MATATTVLVARATRNGLPLLIDATIDRCVTKAATRRSKRRHCGLRDSVLRDQQLSRCS